MADKRPKHKAKPSKNKTARYGRNKSKCEAYRRRRGKPRGPGVPGNKAGKNKRAGSPSGDPNYVRVGS